MKRIVLATIVGLILLAGCGQQRRQSLLSVDFEQGQALRYEFISEREVTVDWKKSDDDSAGKKDKYTEKVEMVVSYTPMELPAFGPAQVQVQVESVKARRVSSSGRSAGQRDAIESLEGKTFVVSVDPTGKLVDGSELKAAIMEAGDSAFRSDTSRGRIKEPDMIDDFTTTQWFMWDVVASVDDPLEEVEAGDSWDSQLPIPGPMIMKKARNVAYDVKTIVDSNEGRIVVIDERFSLAEKIAEESDWPLPYEGSFRMSGTFGFLRGYKPTQVSGEGKLLYNLDRGRIEQWQQDYEVKMTAGFSMMLNIKTDITIDQKMSMKLLGQ